MGPYAPYTMNEENSKIKTWVTLSNGWDGLPIAYHIQMEGGESLVGQVQNKKELKNGDNDEEAEDKKERLSQYDGMVKKYPAEQLVKALKKVKNKDEYFIFCDQNSLWVYAEQLLKAGFTKGLFPTKADYDFEKGREEAMQFVKENYPGVKIINYEKYSTVEEAKAAVEASEVPLVIQSEGDYVSTIVGEDDVEKSKITILASLDKHEKDYAKGEIIIKEKLVKPVEITPQIVFWNGVPVFTDIDIETKNIGDGENNGNQVGCGTNLVIRTEISDEINNIAFPPKVYEMAKGRKGIFVWDISLYFTDNGIYFGEFCSNRMGYDALMTECAMSGGVIPHFEGIMEGVSPLLYNFGTAVRIFNLNRTKEQEITDGKPDTSWLYEVKMKDDKLMSVGDCWDLGVVTGVGDTVEEAVDDVYENYKELTFKEKYSRSKEDFLSDYPTSIVHRYKAVNGTYFNAPELTIEEKGDPDLKKMSKNIDQMGKDYSELAESIQKQITDMKEFGPKIQTTRTKLKDKLKSMINGRP